ncbi:MAG: DNA internalization-related competence protein ComEC/Rec2, partial [Gammaproteobacteria bacterium]|nr:DNA internalization-related competence protein ComEC/Rec2 [Gammaproteobacteria bacterium]
KQWDAYAATGTSHLMAISGLHIGLAASALFLLAWGVSSALPGRRNCRDHALVAALLAAVAYAAMSGFAVPARRACVMVFLAAFVTLRRREISPSILLAMTAAIVFLADPLTLLTPGFKMSFAAVAVLFVIANRHLVIPLSGPLAKPCAGLLRLSQVQLGLLAGLLPLTVALFERFSAIAPFVNILVLPVFNFVTVPFSIAGALLDGPLSPVGDQFLKAAHQSIELVLAIVSFAAKNDWLSFRTAVPVSWFVLLLPLLQILLPAGWPGRRLVLLAVLAIVTARPKPLPSDCFDYHVLDVGQGLAVVVQTREHALLFDTGPSFQSGNNTAEMVVNPFLQHAGIDRLDVIVVSHGDLDHAGGIQAMIRSTTVGRVLTGEYLPSLGIAQKPCFAGQTWQWDGIDFRVLHPRVATAWQRNNASCVIEISAGKHRLLLTGDIESPVEILLQHRQKFRQSHAVVVPHHGSRTSSSAALVDGTAPAVAIVSASRTNRWGFPREDVVTRWQVAGARVVNTGQAGAISQQLCRDRPPGSLKTARSVHRRYWHDTPLDRW